MGIVPSQDDWKTQVDYRTEVEEIKIIKNVEISKSDLDIARLQGKNIEELKSERLRDEKERLLRELKTKYGIKEEIKEQPRPEGIPENTENRQHVRTQKLWELLDGKGLIKKQQGDSDDGLQNKA